MGEVLDIWRENITIRFGSVDRSDRLSLWSMFDFFQEAAISHAENLGVGRDALAKGGQAWILSRLSLFVERRPTYGETIEVSTWPRSWEKLFARRDYTIRDAAGKAIVRGRGGWLVLDVEKRRPLRPQATVEPLPTNEGIDAFPAGAAALESRENLTKAALRTALYSDIDYYGHMNNARYIQWIQDATDMDALTNAAQFRLDINYLSEVMPGDPVEIWTAPLTDVAPTSEGAVPENAGVSANAFAGDFPSKPGLAFAYEGRRPDSGQAVFRVELRTGA